MARRPAPITKRETIYEREPSFNSRFNSAFARDVDDTDICVVLPEGTASWEVLPEDDVSRHDVETFYLH